MSISGKTKHGMPFLMGAVMGVMMLWMLHGALAGGTMSAGALIGFVLAHLVVAVVAAALALFGARLSPRVRSWLARVHRPSLRHIGAMMASAVIMAGAIHVIAHGFGGL